MVVAEERSTQEENSRGRDWGGSWAGGVCDQHTRPRVQALALQEPGTWCVSVVFPALGRWEQELGKEFKVILRCIVRSEPPGLHETLS